MVEDVIARFSAEYLDMHSISAQRRQQQLNLITRLASDLEGPITELTAADVNAFVGRELARGIHPNTGRKYMGMVRSFAAWGEQTGLLVHADELRAVQNPRGSTNQGKPKPYGPAEIARMRADVASYWPAIPIQGRGSQAMTRFVSGKVSHMNGYLRAHARRLQIEAQIALALEQGLRRIEINELSIAAMHPENDQLVVRNAKQAPGQNVKRAIPYTMHARKVVGEWLELRWAINPNHTSPWLTLGRIGHWERQFKPQTLGEMENILALCGHWNWHRLRHTAATEWLRALVPIEKVQIYMGHSSIQQTLAYAKIAAADVDDAFGAAEGEFNRRLGLAA